MLIRLLSIISAILIFSGAGIVFAESIPTVLILDKIPTSVKIGDQITFSGILMSKDQNYVIMDSTIYIKDDDFGLDDVIAKTKTDANGEFTVSVLIKNWDEYSGSVEIYAVYEGNDNIGKARSETQTISITYDSPVTQIPFESTILTFTSDKQSVYAGNSVTFSGRLVTSDGVGLSDKLVQIKEDDFLLSDQVLSYGITDSNGYYHIKWDASAGLVEKDFDVYAVYDGDGSFNTARTANHNLSVLKYSGNITLDPIPSSASIGDVIVFSGTLSLDAQDPTNAIVYIKDEDSLNPDDLLVTAYVDGYGKFSTSWIVRNVDEDSVADIYAVFEGDNTQYRLTTCDDEPTFDFGGTCTNTQKLRILESEFAIPEPPKNYEDKEYMELIHSLDFTDNPKVALVPSPDSYDSVKSHIIPAQEGIIMWKSMLEQKYGGDWNVDFEVITPGKLFGNTRPDVVMNLVTGDEDSGCKNEYYGWAKMQTTRPIQIHVCSDDGQTKRDNAGLASTSAHEFIHAIGLGHTFNKKGDMMCSWESDYGFTCPITYSKSKTPSKLNLQAVVEIYGTDGFKIPNNSNPLSVFTLDEDTTSTKNKEESPYTSKIIRFDKIIDKKLSHIENRLLSISEIIRTQEFTESEKEFILDTIEQSLDYIDQAQYEKNQGDNMPNSKEKLKKYLVSWKNLKQSSKHLDVVDNVLSSTNSIVNNKQESKYDKWGMLGSDHAHAAILVKIFGDTFEFSSPAFQTKSSWIHFEGRDGTTIHKHATNVDLGYLFETLAIDLDEKCYVFPDGRSFCTDENYSLRFFINREQVLDIRNYEIVEGDRILIIFGAEIPEEIEAYLLQLDDQTIVN